MKMAMRWMAMLVFTAMAGVPLCPRPAKQHAIPFRFGEAFRVMLIEGEINGNHTWLVVDTGSNRTVISAKAVFASTDADRPLIPAFFIASTSGPTLVLPNGNFAFR